ncbi:unnamed protein product [Didymodactylos carnosus]|uniref:Mitochondrial nucleoid factor 1 n=1 Tax=Didymodactylos carnosus TaxID=1234261 RepID=A0A813T9S3_9BILA|nr:unnamed protein product [Didymodactylos carnosus]CAF1467183.1 unnamed protein product [Didymodactylos carnosus]CAF3597182.1 unnamed protein product [Didymodactylos carnosus]CAF4259619.1 unnamed protein product [Didymodactylos carnosus]
MAQKNVSQLYFDLIRLFKQWPIDKSKTGRDLGEALRKQFSDSFSSGENSSVDVAYWTKFYSDMKYLISNEIRDTYPRDRDWTASGMSAEQIRWILSNKSLEMNKKFAKRLK